MKLKKEEMDELIEMSVIVIQEHLSDNPKEFVNIVEAYRQLSPQQQKDVDLMQGLGCNGHTLNLLLDCCSKDETKTTKDNMINDRAANIIQRICCQNKNNLHLHKHLHHYAFKGYKELRDVSLANDIDGFIVSMAKMFPSTVDKISDPRLQAKNELDAFSKEKETFYRVLPGKLGSRQSYNVEVAVIIVANTGFYSNYFDTHRNGSDPNKLAVTCNAGLNDKFIQAGLRARGFISTAFNETARWFTHATVVPLAVIGTANGCMESFIQDIEFYSVIIENHLHW